MVIAQEELITATTEKEITLMGKLQQDQASWISVETVLRYPDIPAAAHELAAIMQFWMTYELVTATAKLAKEHEDKLMVQRALAGDIENNKALNRIGKKRQGKTRHLAIELPVLNMALGEVHQELKRTRTAAKDMVYHSKKTRKGADLAVQRLLESRAKIQALERQVQEAEESRKQTSTAIEPATNHDKLLEELQAQTAITEKAKKANAVAEMEISRLRE